MPFLKLENYHFHYTITGNKQQPVVLFLHGFLGNGDDFKTSISQLSSHYYCLTIDLPGHGKTQVLGGDDYYTMAKTAAGLIDFLNHLNLKQCNLIGYSMGGRLALYLTLYFPEYFQRVILESSSPGLKTKTEQLQRLKFDQNLAKSLENLAYSSLEPNRTPEFTTFQEFLNWWYHQPLFQSLKNHPEFPNILQQRLNNNPQELAKSLRYMGTGKQPSLWEKLSQNQVPLLLLVGEYDVKFQKINQEMANSSSLMQLQIIPNCGHNIQIENRTVWVNTILNFLKSS